MIDNDDDDDDDDDDNEAMVMLINLPRNGFVLLDGVVFLNAVRLIRRRNVRSGRCRTNKQTNAKLLWP